MSATIPSNAVFANGVGAILDAQLNSMVQNAGLVANLRNFVGLNGMAVQLLGGTSLGDGANGQFYFNSGSTANDDGVNVIAPNGLLTGRWLRLFDPFVFTVYNVKACGALGNGTNDDTAAVQAAMAACAAGGGGIVYFPPGTYLITGTLANTTTGMTLQGANWTASTIRFQNGSADCITSEGSNFLTGQIEGFIIKDLTLDHASKTGGRTFFAQYCDRIICENVKVLNPWTMFELYANNTVIIKNVWNEAVTGGAGAFALYIHAAGDGSNRTDYVALEDFASDLQYSGANGIVIDGEVATVLITRSNILRSNIGLQVNNSAASSSFYPNFIHATDLSIEGALTASVQINSGQFLKFTSCDISNNTGAAGQGSADTNAVQVYQDPLVLIRSVQFMGCWIAGSQQSALICEAKNIRLIGNEFECFPGSQAANYPAVYCGPTVQGFTFIGNSTWVFGSPNNWKYGLEVDYGTTQTGIIESLNQLQFSGSKELLWKSIDSMSYAGADLTNSEFGAKASITAYPSQAAITGPFTLTAQQMLNIIWVGGGSAGAVIATTATAAQLVQGWPSASANSALPWTFINASNGTVTVTAGAGVTYAGVGATSTTFTVSAGAKAEFWLTITNATPGSEAVVMWGTNV